MISFDPNKGGFGRHETFPLRFGWLTKGYRAWCENPEVFGEDDPTVVLGVGKNMVSAIRFWMEAGQVVESKDRMTIEPTAIGKFLFSSDSGHDPYLEDDATLWLIHWLIASNPEQATAFYWFFNHYHKPEFTTAELTEALKDFVRERMRYKISETTLKHDITVLLRMYEPSVVSKSIPLEEGLDSPLSSLGLIYRGQDTKLHISHPIERRRLPMASFGYAVLDLMEATKLTSIPIERLLHADSNYAAPGSVFRLSEEGLITKLEELVRLAPDVFELRETAGIHQFYNLKQANKFDMLNAYYGQSHMQVAA